MKQTSAPASLDHNAAPAEQAPARSHAQEIAEMTATPYLYGNSAANNAYRQRRSSPEVGPASEHPDLPPDMMIRHGRDMELHYLNLGKPHW